LLVVYLIKLFKHYMPHLFIWVYELLYLHINYNASCTLTFNTYVLNTLNPPHVRLHQLRNSHICSNTRMYMPTLHLLPLYLVNVRVCHRSTRTVGRNIAAQARPTPLL
jgi:hypothetical protein